MTAPWPARCSLAHAAQLFTAAGHPVDRSSLSRFVVSRAFPTDAQGRAKLVDPAALYAAFTADYSRRVMAGEFSDPESGTSNVPQPRRAAEHVAGGSAGPPHPAGASPPTPRTDPKREETELKVQRLRTDMAVQQRQLVPTSEVAALAAVAIASLRAASAQRLRDDVDALVVELNLPVHKAPLLRAGLKRHVRRVQEAFAAAMADRLARLTAPEGEDRPAGAGALPGSADELAFLLRLAAYAIRLQGDHAPD